MTTNRTALVLGATGGIGGAIAKSLMSYGWSVRALVRDPQRAAAGWQGPSPDWIRGDAMQEAEVITAAAGAEVIVHAVNPPGYRDWERLVLPMMANTIAAAKTAGGVRVVLPGTIYNFDPARASLIGADTPQTSRTRKGAIRIKLERMLEEAAPAVPSLVLRAGDFFGPGARASWFAQGMIKPGQPVRRLVNPAVGAGHSWAYLPDLAETFARLLNAPDRLGCVERVQFEGFCDTSGTGIPDAIRRVVGRDLPERAFPWWLMRLLSPFGGFPREVVEIEPYWRHPVRLDNRRLIALIGEEVRTPLDQAIAATLRDLGCLEHGATVETARAA